MLQTRINALQWWWKVINRDDSFVVKGNTIWSESLSSIKSMEDSSFPVFFPFHILQTTSNGRVRVINFYYINNYFKLSSGPCLLLGLFYLSELYSVLSNHSYFWRLNNEMRVCFYYIHIPLGLFLRKAEYFFYWIRRNTACHMVKAILNIGFLNINHNSTALL